MGMMRLALTGVQGAARPGPRTAAHSMAGRRRVGAVATGRVRVEGGRRPPAPWTLCCQQVRRGTLWRGM